LIFEAKYDELREVPSKLYHVSIQEYKNNILKRGLIPKSNSKRTVHLDRIYVCKTVEAVKTIINQLFIPFEFEFLI
jgi:RNA:NAD 2'-phosphotransferase (TPT1/KptA family)